MENNEQILKELISIRKLLTTLAQEKLEVFNETIKSKYLKTEQRQKMYDLFDGTKSLKDIAEEVKVTPEAVRQFAVLLENANLIEYVVINAKQKNPIRIF